MADPRSKPKQPKAKKGNAPHMVQQSKIAAQVTSKPQVQKTQGRGK